MKVDNFKEIKQLLDFDKPGDCYWIQLLRRASDDPSEPGKSNPKYHGKMASRIIASYFITSRDTLDELHDDIIKICEALNCRAYIMLNKRNYEKMTKAMLVNISEKIVSNCFCSPAKIAFSTAGKSNSAETKRWIVDVDIEYLPYFNKVVESIEKSETSKVIITELPTKSGKHLITRKFNTEQYKSNWAEIRNEILKHDNSDNIPIEPPTIQKDNPTILYIPGFLDESIENFN